MDQNSHASLVRFSEENQNQSHRSYVWLLKTRFLQHPTFICCSSTMRIKKTKVSKADKNRIRDTVNSIAKMRLSNNRNEEMDGLIRSNGRMNGNRNRNNTQSRSNEGFWKALAFCMFGILVLFVTDTIQFKTMEQSHASMEGDGVSEVDVIFGGHVETKPPKVPTPLPSNAPTRSPVSVPPTMKPINSPTAKPTAALVEETPAPVEAAPAKGAPAKEAPVPKPTNQDPPGRHTYKPRGQPMTDKAREAMEKKWGKWTLEPDAKKRPTKDYYAAYPNRDIPFNKFPKNAWQKDKDWLSKFLPQSIQLVDRAMNAILEEYGEPTDGSSELFNIEKYESWVDNMAKEPCKGQAGCTTTKSYENLRRRLLHAVMTEDNFVFAMCGHSAAAGHGNHFQQSYTLQVQWILEGVFSRLGVRHQARNIAMGGLGTTQTGLATKQIMGHDVDILMWDSGMTEKESQARDMFFRQGILGGGKVPMLAAASPRNDVIKLLNEVADADVAMIGEHTVVKKTDTLEEVMELPWAAQYVNCGAEISSICRQNEYVGRCWIDRDDVTPPKKQKPAPDGRASWHPGNRKHQITGRQIAFMILEALKDALTMWNDAADYKLPDDAWHVTSIYDNTRSKIENLDPDVGSCKKYEEFSKFMCNTHIKARSEFTPRAYPDFTNIRSIMPPSQLEQINDPPQSIYEEDVFNPDLHPPEGALDVLNIIEAGLPYTSTMDPDYITPFHPKPKFDKVSTLQPGKGYHLDTYAGFCDGSVDSFCHKSEDANCLLYNHNDGRKGLLMDAYSGWMVTNLPEFKHGFIAIKLETWHRRPENLKTKDWTSMNNEGRKLSHGRDEPFLRSPSQDSVDVHRVLGKKPPPEYCDDFKFEFAIDGKVTQWTKSEWDEHAGKIQRVVELYKIVEDPSLTGGEEKEIEFAFRLLGCPEKEMKLTHIYWA